MNVIEAVDNLYRTRWSTPARQAVFRTGGYQIEIYKWEGSSNGLGVDLYATLGASADDMPGAGPGHRVEYFVGLQPGKDDIASPLAALGMFAQRHGETVDHGHTVSADGPLWQGSEMSTFLVLRQIGEILPPLSVADGVHVEFLQAVPVFESERQFKITHSTEALLQRWKAHATPFWDPCRVAEPAV